MYEKVVGSASTVALSSTGVACSSFHPSRRFPESPSMSSISSRFAVTSRSRRFLHARPASSAVSQNLRNRTVREPRHLSSTMRLTAQCVCDDLLSSQLSTIKTLRYARSANFLESHPCSTASPQHTQPTRSLRILLETQSKNVHRFMYLPTSLSHA